MLLCDGLDILLGDALARINVRAAQALRLSPGFLVVFDGTWDGTRLADASLVWSDACPAPAAGGEFSRLAFDGVGKNLVERARALEIARRFFNERAFIEVETPTRVRAPGLDAHVEPVPASGGWLVTSPELHLKRLIAGGIPRVFDFARCHRADESGPYHEPEFTMLEWYRAFEPVEAVMQRRGRARTRDEVRALHGQLALAHRG